jgi:hypothetical protein
MTPTRSRLCRRCGARFLPARYDGAVCAPCGDAERDRLVIEEYLHGAPLSSLERTSIVTGVPPAEIRRLAEAGLLARVPADLGPDAEVCSCPPGRTGRCLACRVRLAAELRDVREGAEACDPSRDGTRRPGRPTGLHSRRGR